MEKSQEKHDERLGSSFQTQLRRFPKDPCAQAAWTAEGTQSTVTRADTSSLEECGDHFPPVLAAGKQVCQELIVMGKPCGGNAVPKFAVRLEMSGVLRKR